ncbi:MAG: hypothetical protein GKR87_01260 [Kiritimatiellae bacterium]|nr:hypothetical protein [Kiritimatiellia bacterium]
MDEEEANKRLYYFENNAKRMQYKTFRETGYFIGSGVVEAGCKTVVGQRAKQSGMFWSVQGAQCVLSLRCCIAGDTFDKYWEQQKVA